MLTVPRVDPGSLRMLRDFSDVMPISRGDPVPAWQPTRLNARHHAALRLAELVLRATSVEYESGGVAVNGFLLDMPKLFEDFVTMALREALVGEYGGRVAGQERHYLDEAGQVVLRPDIIWKVRGSAVAVIDAKYKAEKPAGYPNPRPVSAPRLLHRPRPAHRPPRLRQRQRGTRPPHRAPIRCGDPLPCRGSQLHTWPSDKPDA